MIKNETNQWIVPQYITNQLGQFDWDVSAPFNAPWSCAGRVTTISENGLGKDWDGRIFCFPPGSELLGWLKKCAAHKNSIVLVFAKTDTKAFQDVIFPNAYGLYFLKGRVKFHYPDGEQADSSPFPSVLVAFDEPNSRVLEQCKLPGYFLALKN